MSDVSWNFSSPDEDYDPKKKSEFNLTHPSELSAGSFDIPQHVKDTTKGQAALIGVGRGMDRAYKGVKDLALAGGEMFGVAGSKEKRAKLKQQIEEENKMWDQGLGNDLAPTKNWAKGGEIGGQIATGLAIPGGGQTMLGRAGLQALYNGLFEAGTTAGSAADRLAAGGLGAVGAGLGSLGMDSLVKPIAGMAGKWSDDAAHWLDLKATEMGLKPSIGELKSKVQRNMSYAELAKAHPNNPAAIEAAVQDTPGARHRTEIEARKLKEVLGITDDINTSTVLPKVDADNLNKMLSQRSAEIWKPFNQSVKGAKTNVFPLELWNSLQDVAAHNSKILGDSSAIPDDVVRGQLDDLLKVNNPNKLPKYSPEEYSKIVSELGNAQHRTSILSGGQTPTYDTASVARVTDMFGKAKNDMEMWGKKNPDIYANWEKALADHQAEIVPVRGNPVFETATKLNPKGRDVTKLAARVTDDASYAHLNDLIKQYRKFGMDSAADRLENMDTLRHATSILGGTPGDGSVSLVSKLGLPFEAQSRKPWAKNIYFGDAGIQAPTKLDFSLTGGKSAADLGLGALGQMRRAAPLGYSREHGGDAAVLAAMLKDLLGGDDGDVNNEQDPNYSHGIGAATQAGAVGR